MRAHALSSSSFFSSSINFCKKTMDFLFEVSPDTFHGKKKAELTQFDWNQRNFVSSNLWAPHISGVITSIAKSSILTSKEISSEKLDSITGRVEYLIYSNYYVLYPQLFQCSSLVRISASALLISDAVQFSNTALRELKYHRINHCLYFSIKKTVDR